MPRTSRSTKQKQDLAQATRTFKSFFDAQDLADKTELPLATVYRYLKSATADGNLYSYTCNGRTIYSTKKRSHCHYICEETGKITHFDIDSLDFLKNKIPGSIDSFQIEVKGTCNVCK